VKRGGTANTCAPAAHVTASFVALQTAATSSPDQVHVKGTHKSASGSLPPAIGSPSPPRARNPLVRAVSLNDAPASIRPLLFVLLAISISLLAAAAAPQRVMPAGRAAAVVAERRAYLAAAGIWLLVVVAVVTAFT
jgi:hypothetical protein